MIDAVIFTTFLIISIGVVIIPGPNVLLIVSTSISHGKKRGLQTVAGTSTAMAVQLLIAAFATSWFINLFTEGLNLLKWLGVGYLVCLSVKHLRSINKADSSPPGLSESFSRGFFVSLLNPKTIMFFTAFLPQFISPEYAYLPQLIILSLSFLILAVILDSAYALLADGIQLRLELQNQQNNAHRLSAAIYFIAAIYLALSHRQVST